MRLDLNSISKHRPFLISISSSSNNQSVMSGIATTLPKTPFEEPTELKQVLIVKTKKTEETDLDLSQIDGGDVAEGEVRVGVQTLLLSAPIVEEAVDDVAQLVARVVFDEARAVARVALARHFDPCHP